MIIGWFPGMWDWMCRGRGEVHFFITFHLKFILIPSKQFPFIRSLWLTLTMVAGERNFKMLYFLASYFFCICMKCCMKCWGAARQTCILIPICFEGLCMNLQPGMLEDGLVFVIVFLSALTVFAWIYSWECHKTNENTRPLICPGKFMTGGKVTCILERIKYMLIQLLLKPRVRLHTRGDTWWARRMQNWTLWLWQSGKKSLKVCN